MPTIDIAIRSRQVRTGARQINTAVTSIKATMRSTVNAVERGNKRMASSFQGVAGALTTVKAGFAALGLTILIGALTRATRLMVEFSNRMLVVRGVTGATSKQFTDLTDKARELGATTRFTASEVASAMEFLGRAGFSVSEVLETTAAVLNLAAAGQLELGRAADIVTNIMSNFSLAAEDAGQAVDVLARQSTAANTNIEQMGVAFRFVGTIGSAVGLSMEELSANLGTLADAGLKGEKAGTGLRGIIVRLQKPTAEASRALKDLGLSENDVDIRAVGLTGALKNLRDAGIESSSAFKIFERRSVAAALALIKNIEKTEEATDANFRAAGSGRKLAETMTSEIGGALLFLKSAFEELILSMGEGGFVSAIQAVAKGLTDMSRDSKDTASAIGTFLGGAVRAIGIVFELATAPLVLFSKSLAGVAFILSEPTKALQNAKIVMAELSETAEGSEKRLKRLLGFNVDAAEAAAKAQEAAKKEALQREKALQRQIEIEKERKKLRDELLQRGEGDGKPSGKGGKTGGLSDAQKLADRQQKAISQARLRLTSEAELSTQLLEKARVEGFNAEAIRKENQLNSVLLGLQRQGVVVTQKLRTEFSNLIEIRNENLASIEALKKAQKEANELEQKRKDFVATTLENLQLENERLKELIDIRKLDTEQQRIALEVQKATLAAKRQGIDLSDKEIEKIRALAEANDALRQRLEEQAKKGPLQTFAQQAVDAGTVIQQAFVDAFQGAEDALVEFTKTGKLNFSDMVNGFIDDLIRLAIRQQIIKPIAGLLSGGTGGAQSAGGGSGLGSLLGAVGGLFSSGGADFTGGTTASVPFTAKGGIVDRPSIAGEAGPEAVIPLSGNRKVPVEFNGGSGAVVNVTLNINNPQDAESIRRSQQQIAQSTGQLIERSLARNGTNSRRI